MSLLDPHSAEEKMTWVPIIGCFVPLVIVVLIVLAVIFA